MEGETRWTWPGRPSPGKYPSPRALSNTAGLGAGSVSVSGITGTSTWADWTAAS
ncbi:MAG: hypothetical protein ACLSUW_04410 [Akkermansia sp.]